MTAVNYFMERLLLLPIALISLALFIEYVHAQSLFTPISAGGSASVFIEGKSLYIQAGETAQGTTRQTFSLSLHSSWNTTSPAYTTLRDGFSDSRFPNTLLKDGVSWFAVSNKTFVIYNILTGDIAQYAPAGMYSNLVGLNAVFDQGLGEVVIPNGFTNSVRTTTLYITPGNLSTRADALPDKDAPPPVKDGPPDLTGLVRYSLAWSNSAQKAMLFGGLRPPSALSATLFQRNSSTWGTWLPVNAIGGPSARESACMVPALNGTKMIVFGGSAPLDVPLSDIFIYDVTAGTWYQGVKAGPKHARSAHACAVSGDALIAWGGFSNTTARTQPGEMISVYNLTSNAWVDKFISPNGEQVPTSISKPSPTSIAGPGSDSGSRPEPDAVISGSGNNTGAIIGGVVAAVLVLAALGFLLWRRDQKKKRRIVSNVHHHQSEEKFHDYKEPVEKRRDPHVDLNVKSIPYPGNGVRHPQLDIARRERELAAEMEMLRNDRGSASTLVQHAGGRPAKISGGGGGGSPHTLCDSTCTQQYPIS